MIKRKVGKEELKGKREKGKKNRERRKRKKGKKKWGIDKKERRKRGIKGKKEMRKRVLNRINNKDYMRECLYLYSWYKGDVVI